MSNAPISTTDAAQLGASRYRLGISGFEDLSVRFYFSLSLALAVFVIVAVLAVVVSYTILGTGYLAASSAGNTELFDRAIYVPFYLIAPIAILAANLTLPAQRMPPQRNAIALLPALVIVHVGLSRSGLGWQLMFLLLALTVTAAVVCWSRGSESAPDHVRLVIGKRASWLDAIAFLAIIVLLVPANADRLAAHIGTNIAKISYFVGPALYSYGTNLTPGLDFWSHYGVGLGPIFALMMGSGWRSAAVNAIELTVILTVIFYLMMYALLVFMTGSRALAFAVSVFFQILNFSTYFPFDAPSTFPVRYPFLIPFVLAFGWYCGTRRWLGPVAAMSGFAGLSLFWHAEIGIYLALAGAGGIVLTRGFGPFEIGKVGLFLTAVVGFFYAVSWIFVGSSALSLAYLLAAMQPFTAYAGGWDGEPIKWDTFWSLFYNLPFQVVAIATIGCFWFLMRRDDLSVRERQIAGVLAMLSLVGLGMLSKWINRSLDAVWHQNAAPLAIVLAWWVHFLWVNSGGRTALVRFSVLARASTASALFIAAVAFLLFVQDRANPYPYGLRSYVHYPSLGKSIVARSHLYDDFTYNERYFLYLNTGWDWPDLLTEISQDDVGLIQQYVKPHERAAVISIVDWAYLAQAQRAPKAFFVPILWSFDAEFLARSMQDAEFVFVDKRLAVRPDLPSIAQLFDVISRNYEMHDQSRTLTVYRLKDALGSGSFGRPALTESFR